MEIGRGIGAAAMLLLTGLPLIAQERAHASDPRERMVTAQSIWGQADAIQRASQLLPRDVQVIRTRCTEVNVGIGNFRSICTLIYIPGQAP